MLSMLKADVCRLFTRKGNLYGYLIAYLVVVLAISIGLPMLSDFLNSTGDPELVTDTSALYTSPLAFISGSLLMLGLVSVFADWCVASVCWNDMRGGFNRTIVGCVGKKAYFAEKLLLALVVSFIFVLAGSVVGTAAAAIAVGISGVGSIPSLLLWLVLTTLACWGNAALTLAVLWLLRSNVFGMLAGLALPSGFISSFVALFITSLPQVSEVWEKVVSWLPCSAMTALNRVVDDVLVLDGMQLAHILAPTAVCLVLAFACALTVLRRRDL